MLLTLSARTFAGCIDCSPPSSLGNGRAATDDDLTLIGLPDYAARHLQLRGLNVPASMLAGWGLAELDQLRDSADKAGCPILVLFEDQPLAFGSSKAREDVTDRVKRLAHAAHRLGCNALSISCAGPDTEQSFDDVAAQVKSIMQAVERLELHLLLAPTDGLTNPPDRLTDLIKRVGGFRIGSLPNFAHAADSGDLVGTLRKLAPYAGAVHASVRGFTKGKHSGYDLAECVEAIRSVGFVNTLAIDFIGDGNPLEQVEQARQILQDAIDQDGK